MIWTLDTAVADDGGIIGDGPKGRRRPRRDLLSFPSDLTSVAIVHVSLVLRPLPIKVRFWALQRRCPTRVCNTNCSLILKLLYLCTVTVLVNAYLVISDCPTIPLRFPKHLVTRFTRVLSRSGILRRFDDEDLSTWGDMPNFWTI